MCEVIRREMKLGVYGLFIGLIYILCVYLKMYEFIEMCKVVVDFDGVFVVY